MADLQRMVWKEEARRNAWTKRVLNPLIGSLNAAFALTTMQSDPHVANAQTAIAQALHTLEGVRRERWEWEEMQREERRERRRLRAERKARAA